MVSFTLHYCSLTRSQFSAALTTAGAKLGTSITRNTTHVLIGSKPGADKLEAAEKQKDAVGRSGGPLTIQGVDAFVTEHALIPDTQALNAVASGAVAVVAVGSKRGRKAAIDAAVPVPTTLPGRLPVSAGTATVQANKSTAYAAAVGDRLSARLKGGATLTSISIPGFLLGPTGALPVAAALSRFPQLKTLNLRMNSIGDAGVKIVLGGLSHVQKIANLYLTGNNISNAGARSIADSLRWVPKLKELDLSFNSIGDEGAKSLAAGLRFLPQLTALRLRSNGIGDDGARAIADSLRIVPLLEELDISDNRIGESGIRLVVASLCNVPALSFLYLSKNSIGDAGACALAGVLRTVPMLNRLFLYSSQIGNTGARALVAALPSTPHMQHIDLRLNGISGAEITGYRRDTHTVGSAYVGL